MSLDFEHDFGRGPGRPKALFSQSVAQLRPSFFGPLVIPAPSAKILPLSPTGSQKLQNSAFGPAKVAPWPVAGPEGALHWHHAS